MRTLLALLLVLALPLSVTAAQEDDTYDPVATRLAVEEEWTVEAGALRIRHALVMVPGPGTFDVDLQLPERLSCPPQSALKRKLPETHALITIEAALMSLGWHPDDGFTKLRLISWGLAPRVYHVALYYCP